jgi:TP901 family phage tail tape measure protein
MANSEDVVFSLGFDISSLPSAISTIERTLKNQKLIANIAYQFGTSQAEVRKQFQGKLAELRAEAAKNPIEIRVNSDGKNMDELLDSLPRTRYALYDVSNLAQTASDALIAFGKSAISASANFESAFSDIERTTMSSIEMLDSLDSQLRGLAREIPVAFKDITEIASLGAQLGVTSGDLAGFAETVAQFSAVTNVSTTSAAQSFGALGELLNVTASEYVNLGSSIAQVGVNSVATEAEILSVATAIGGVANSAGLSAEYVIGLAGSLASLRVPAEQSRGALTRVFQEISRSASGTGADMQIFADVIGVSLEQAQSLATSDVELFFDKFVRGLSGIDSTQLTTTLDALSLSDIRVTNVLTRLSRNTELMTKTQRDASSAYEDGTFLAAAYALKAEDLASKLTILQNSFDELIATFGESILPLVKPIIDGVTSMVQSLTDALTTDSGKWTAGILVATSLVAGSLFALISTVALVVAGLYALRTALAGLGWTVASGGMAGFSASLFTAGVNARTLTATLLGTTGAIAGMSRGVALASLAMRALPIIGIVSLLGSLAIAFAEAGESSEIAFQNLVGNTAGLSDALKKDTDAYNSLSTAQERAASGMVPIEYSATSLNEKYGEAAEQLYYTAQVLGKDVPDAAYGASSAIEYNTRMLGENTQAWLTNQLMQSEAFQKIAGNSDFADFVQITGFSFAEAVRLQAAEGEDAVAAYYYRLAKKAYDAGTLTYEQIAAVDADLADAVRNGNDVVANSRADGGANWMNNFGAQFFAKVQQVAPGLIDFANWLAELFGFEKMNFGNVDAQQDALNGLLATASVMDITNQDLAGSSGDAADGLDGLGNSAASAAEKIYTLVDYSNDLSSIWDRAFDIRFSGQSTLDDISDSFSGMAQSTDDARQSMQDLLNDVGSLTADKALQEYFLSVAEAYGDTIRAAELRAKIAKIDSDLTKKNQDLAKAQDKTNKTLVGSSDAAIENRAEITDLVKSYQAHIKALAASGLSQDQLAIRTAELRQDFLDQTTALGYNSAELETYAAAFDDVSIAINNVPRDITVTANTNPALQALNEFEAKARSLASNTYGGGTVQAPINESRLTAIGGLLDPSDVGITRRALEKLNPQGLILIGRQLYKQGWAEGGYTGAGGKYEVAGVVHRGEYVVPKQDVNQQTGTPYFMNQPRSFAQGGYAGSAASSMMVELSPTDRALLRSAGGSGEVVLYANNEAIARSVNAGNRSIVAAGGRP